MTEPEPRGTGRVEELLRARGRELDARPLLSPEREAAARAELAALAEAEAARERRRRWGLWSLPLAAAAALLVWFGTFDARSGDHGARDAQVPLLDGAGRPLDTALRDGGARLPAPDELLLELVPAGAGHARVVVYASADAGRRRDLTDAEGLALAADEDTLRAFPLGDVGADLAVLVVLSRAPVPLDALDDAVPAQLDLDDPAALEAAAATAAERLGCTVLARRLAFADEG